MIKLNHPSLEIYAKRLDKIIFFRGSDIQAKKLDKIIFI